MPSRTRSEIVRRSSSKARVLAALIAAGDAGLTNEVLNGICFRYGARIKELLKDATAGAPRSAIGLVLALVSQETGNKLAANELIREHKLDELFGIQVQ